MFKITMSGWTMYVFGIIIGFLSAHLGLWMHERQKAGKRFFLRKRCTNCDNIDCFAHMFPCVGCKRNKHWRAYNGVKFVKDEWIKLDVDARDKKLEAERFAKKACQRTQVEKEY